MKLIFEYNQSNTNHTPVEENDVGLPEELKRSSLPLPDVNEVQIIRHYTELSKKNYGIDTNFYPLGSCTMKYNPRVNEDLAKLPGFSNLHPHMPASHAQGALQVIWELEKNLKEITGMDAFSLQPAAGSQCELLGVMIAKKYFAEKNENRTKIIIPDSAHGTNPATAAMCKFQIITILTDDRGNMDLDEFKRAIGPDVAVVMITNPNTLGLFEENLSEIKDLAKENGALMYCDGANMNALLGISRPADQGFDMIHLNLHKTFSTPHGGGGPGGGALGVKSFLEDYLPVPRIKKENDQFVFDFNIEKSVGKLHSFYGNFGILVRALAYIKSWGSDIQKVSQIAVLNANYLFSLLKEDFDVPYDRRCAHEFVISAKKFGEKSTANIAKRIIDYGFHAPTIYFPLIVKEALMIEPTETESKETLDEYAHVLKTIIKELKEDPDLVKNAPHTIPGRLDEVKAARQLNLRWVPQEP
jgi:glycine dehydrogenase subunit 2